MDLDTRSLTKQALKVKLFLPGHYAYCQRKGLKMIHINRCTYYTYVMREKTANERLKNTIGDLLQINILNSSLRTIESSRT